VYDRCDAIGIGTLNRVCFFSGAPAAARIITANLQQDILKCVPAGGAFSHRASGDMVFGAVG
jgi:hypothetical protein